MLYNLGRTLWVVLPTLAWATIAVILASNRLPVPAVPVDKVPGWFWWEFPIWELAGGVLIGSTILSLSAVLGKWRLLAFPALWFGTVFIVTEIARSRTSSISASPLHVELFIQFMFAWAVTGVALLLWTMANYRTFGTTLGIVLLVIGGLIVWLALFLVVALFLGLLIFAFFLF